MKLSRRGFFKALLGLGAAAKMEVVLRGLTGGMNVRRYPNRDYQRPEWING